MAINPNFVFADPQLQQQVVAMAQVKAAQDAARAQQFAQTLAEQRRQRQEAADREERQAIREGDIRRQEAQQAENRRQFDESLRYNREALASQENVNKTRLAEADEKELYNNLLNLVEKGDVVPTLSELNARMAGLSPSRKQALVERRQARFDSALKDFNILSDEAARLNAKVGVKDQKTGLTPTADDVLNRSQHKRLMRIGDNGLIEPLLTRPREDVVPGAAPASTSFQVPPPAAPPAVESITDIQKRAASPSLIMRGGQEVGDLLYQNALRRIGQGAGNVMAQQAGGVLSRMLPGAAEAPPSPGVLDRAGSYLRGSVMPSLAEGLNRMEIGPDLTGYFPREQDYPIVSPPLPMPPRRTANVVIDADTGDILAPPVFAPPY
jgi:hypothetical protein